MRTAMQPLSRYIATPRVAKHRMFAWMNVGVLPDSRLYVICRQDDTTFGILHSRFHEIWSLRTCSWHGVGNDPTYNAASCFETFPFPKGLTPADTSQKTSDEQVPFSQPVPANVADSVHRFHADAIANAAFNLNSLRENWLNPPEWVEWVITPEEEKAGYPKRPVAKPGHESDLKKRTLTKLYNARPSWLDNAHKVLDKAVAAAYGWSDYTSEMSDDEILHRLLALNMERPKVEKKNRMTDSTTSQNRPEICLPAISPGGTVIP